MKKNIEGIVNSSIDVKQDLLKNETANIEKAVQVVQKSIAGGGKLLIFGNGGSAADSQHIAAEFVGRYKSERKAMPAIALTTNASNLTAISNDYGFEAVFKKQIEALGNKGDVALAISTSGESKNIIEAVKEAKKKGLLTIGLTGKDGGALRTLCDISIAVSSQETARIQESHILIGHIIAEIIESNLFG